MDWLYLLQLLGFAFISLGFIKLAEKLAEEKRMTVLYAAMGVLVIALFVYLFIALLKPELFP